MQFHGSITGFLLAARACPFWFLMVSLGVFAQGFAPQEAAKKMKVADGFAVDLIVSEPMVAQPVCIEFDDQGRLWVIQYLQYPNPAGLQRVKVDRYSRTVYDKVPEPPPRGPKGADRITILEPAGVPGGFTDSNVKAKDFISGLNLASGIAFGHGGVFILQVPYLLFYPDRNRDDVPDSDPEVLLTGFGMEDAHSVANSLTWGPDGWLYGCQGSTVTANIRGIEFQQGIWRYHPITKRFELFCEGGGNSWGIDFDEDGNIIYATNFGGYRGLHAVQGAYYWKQFGKHGALHNPYAYGYIDHMPHDHFTGGHVTVSGVFYRGETFPEQFRNKYLHVDTLGHGILWTKIERNGSSFQTRHGGELLAGNDTWFAPCDGTIGPDGALYFSDWHDKRTAHPDPDADWDRSNGRIYKLHYPAIKTPASPATGDITRLSSDELIEILSHRNDWYVRKARRALADRRDVKVYPRLRAMVFDSKDEHLALEALWALYVSGGGDESYLNDLLKHKSAAIRRWAVRFLGDQEQVSPTTTEHLVKLAEAEPNIMVRSQLACTAKRLPAKHGLVVAQKIASQNLDAKDPHIPLLLWWAVEKHSVEAPDLVFDLFATGPARQTRVVAETLLPRVLRRYAAEGSTKTLEVCGRLFEAAPENERPGMLLSLEQGFREQGQTNRIKDIEQLPADLRKELMRFWNAQTTNGLVIRLLARLNCRPALERAAILTDDANVAPALRIEAIQALAEKPSPQTTAKFLNVVFSDAPEEIRLSALQSSQALDSPQVTTRLIEDYQKLAGRLRAKSFDVLLSRKHSASTLLQAIDVGKISSKEVSLDQIRQVALHADKDLDALVRKHWGNISGGSTEEKLADIRRFNNDLRAAQGNVKNGREVFMKACSACHELFGEGAKVGPELTHANRQDKDFLLSSIVDPSAVIRKEYLNYNVETSDGRVLSGVIIEQSASGVTLVAAKNERMVISRETIVSLDESSLSLMPEGLMHDLTPQERRDLFAYLQSAKPLEKAAGESLPKAAVQNVVHPAPAAPENRPLEWIKVSADGKGFAGASSGKPFVPLGFNYDRDYKLRLIEEYWDTEWQTVVDDFREMKQLGANVVRVHLQFAKFMRGKREPNQEMLERLRQLLKLAGDTGLYLDVTGLSCYRKPDVPAWFDASDEKNRWAAQAKFWEAIAKTCAESPAVFCYNLMNEPVVSATPGKQWLLGHVANFWYVQAITLDPGKRKPAEIARAWTAKMTAAIRKHDKRHLITVGLLPNSADEPVSGSGFIPRTIAPHLDFMSVHMYPRSGKLDDDLRRLKGFSVGKPVIIEETMLVECSGKELQQFIENSRNDAAGWMGFYWGQTPEDLRATTNTVGALMAAWLDVFKQIQPSVLGTAH